MLHYLVSLFKRLPQRFQHKIFEWILRYLPLLLIQRLPFSYGAYLKCYSKNKGGVIFDCGAHVGNCAILFSRLAGPDGTVVCVEPFKDSYHKLVKRIEQMKLKNVTPVNRGLWKTSESLTLDVFQNTIYCRLPSALPSKREKKSSMLINCTTIDELVSDLKLKRLDLIKMDIEGAEIEALQGAQKTLSDLRPQLAIASYHRRDGQPTCTAVEKILADHGYNCKTFFPPHLTTCGKPR